MTCGICGRDFIPLRKNQIYCNRVCYKKSQSLKPALRELARRFDKEWTQWKLDFAAGLTQSNSENHHEESFQY